MIANPHPWSEQLGTLHTHAWHRLIRGVHDRHAPARHPTLATVSPDGMPQARTVVLRGADPSPARLEVHTHIAASFAVLLLHVQSMDLLHLGPSHRRAVYQRDNDWAGQWVAP